MTFAASDSEDAKNRDPINDGTFRNEIWRRFAGDEWAAFDALPPRIRARLREHAYDAWAVNALMLWRQYRRSHPTPERAERALLRYLTHCENLERRAFAAAWAARCGSALPHVQAGASVRRYDSDGAGSSQAPRDHR